jgi:paraquat-inducible protein B
LYASKSAAQQGLSGPTVPYVFAFASAAGDLEEGAAVTLLGFQVGEVETARLAYDERTGKPFTSVIAELYPQQLDPTGLGAGSVTDWRSATDAKIRKLIRLGFRARLEQSPPLLGARSIALVHVKGAPSDELKYEGANPRIPSVTGSASVDDIAAQADQILAKINRIPIEQIGQNLKAVTDQLHVIFNEVQPQIGPLVSKLNEAAGQISGIALAVKQLLDGEGAAQDSSLPEAIQQLNEAARSIHSLADYIDRHPEALIRGKRPEK